MRGACLILDPSDPEVEAVEDEEHRHEGLEEVLWDDDASDGRGARRLGGTARSSLAGWGGLGGGSGALGGHRGAASCSGGSSCGGMLLLLLLLMPSERLCARLLLPRGRSSSGSRGPEPVVVFIYRCVHFVGLVKAVELAAGRWRRGEEQEGNEGTPVEQKQRPARHRDSRQTSSHACEGQAKM